MRASAAHLPARVLRPLMPLLDLVEYETRFTLPTFEVSLIRHRRDDNNAMLNWFEPNCTSGVAPRANSDARWRVPRRALFPSPGPTSASPHLPMRIGVALRSPQCQNRASS